MENNFHLSPKLTSVYQFLPCPFPFVFSFAIPPNL